MEEISNLTVPAMSVILIFIDVILGLAVPFALLIVMKKRHGVSEKPFLVGVITMVLFNLILKNIAQIPIFNMAGDLTENIWFMGIVGGLMAGLFEEVGRFVAMKWALKPEIDNDYNAFSYGIGHGGFEFMMILVLGMVGNLIIAIAMNTGNLSMLTSGETMNEEAMSSLVNGCKELAQSSPALFLISPIERFAALVAQLGLSLCVWNSVKYQKWYWLPIAILLHTMLDATAVIVFEYTESYFVTELIVWVIALIIALLGFARFRKMKVTE